MSEARANVVALQGGRTPPHNLDAERSLLGGILLDGNALDEVLELVHGSDFYRTAHRHIFEAMVDLAQRSEPIDRVQVKDNLVKLGLMELSGEADDYLDLLDKVVPIAANLAHYAKIVANKSLARRTIETASAIAALGYEQHGDVHEFVDEAEARFFDLRSKSIAGEFKTLHEMLPSVFLEIERRSMHDGSLVGAPSGLEALDGMTSGFKPGNLVIIAGRPSMGKSSLGTDVARAVAEAGGGVGFFSLEMTREELTVRLLSAVSGVDSKNLASGKLNDNEFGRLSGAGSVLDKLPIHLYAKDEVSAGEIRAHARRLAKKLSGTATPLKMVIVDYLQLMYVDEDAERRDIAIGKSTRQLKGLAQQLGLPVLLLAQLNRKVEERPDKRPRMSDLRESGSIENDADLIIFVYRDEVYHPKTDDRGVAELIIGKQRNGPTGTVRVGWKAECSSFRNLYSVPEPPEPPEQLPLREEPPLPTERYP